MAGQREKLLLITAGFPFGDTERGFISTEFELLRQSFDVSIVSVGSQEQLIHPLPENIPVQRYFHKTSIRSVDGSLAFLAAAFRPETRRELACALKGQTIKGALQRIKQIVFYRAKARKMEKYLDELISRENIRLIYTYWCTEAALASVCLKDRHPELKVVTRFHGHDLFQERVKTQWQPFHRLIAEKIDRLIFACQMGQDYFLDTWGKEFSGKAQLHYLGCAPAPQPEKAPSEALRLVSCSNLIPLKRVECIIDAIGLLPKNMQIRWEHFGDGSQRQALEQRASEILSENVSWKFHGRVPNKDLAAWYRKLDPDLFLTTTTTEGGVPVSLQEAFSMSIPAIGTAVGGVPEVIINEVTGYLLDERATAQDLAGAIMNYVSLPEEGKRQLSCQAFSLWQERFDARKNSENFVAELRAMLDN